MSQSRAELFAQARRKREQEKADAASRGAYSGEYESVSYVALSTDTDRVVRLLGLPIASRQEPSDSKLSYIGMLRADDGKKTRIVFPDHQTNKSWILWRIIDLVLDGKYVGSGDSRHREYTYEKSHPECFRRVRWNDNDSNPYENGFYPTSYVNINCIDRSDMEWHRENKHTKLLSKRASKIGDTDSFYFDTGVPVTCYNTIFDEVVEPFGDWEEYDVVIRKLTSTPWYKAYSGTHDFNRLSDVSKTLVVDGPLTEEERSWVRYDLDQLYGITSYSKIKAKLGEFIRKVDVDFKKNFSDELDALVEKEKEQWKAEGKDQYGRKEEPKKTETMSTADWKRPSEEHLVEDEDLVPPAPDTQAPVEDNTPPWESRKEEEVQPSPAPVRRPTRKADIDWAGLADGTFNGKKYLGVPKMTDEERDYVLGVRDDGSFIYKNNPDVTLMENEANGFMSPDFYHVDPLSGQEW